MTHHEIIFFACIALFVFAVVLIGCVCAFAHEPPVMQELATAEYRLVNGVWYKRFGDEWERDTCSRDPMQAMG